jgi:hypothetical protein
MLTRPVGKNGFFGILGAIKGKQADFLPCSPHQDDFIVRSYFWGRYAHDVCAAGNIGDAKRGGVYYEFHVFPLFYNSSARRD